MSRGLWLGATVSCVVAACGHAHIAVAPLPPAPTPVERVQLFSQLRVTGTGSEVTTSCGNTGCHTSSTPFVVLGDGRTVYYPEDLVPVVGPESASGAAARRAATAHEGFRRGLLVFVLGALGGGIVLAEGSSSGNGTEEALGGVIALGSVAVGIAMVVSYGLRLRDETRSAFDQYPKDLATRLALCASGLALVPCESSPGQIGPAVVDPVLRDLPQR